jgi:hypothetical protein
MNFEAFKKAYEDRLISFGADKSEIPHIDRIFEVFVGLVIFSEWQKAEQQKAWDEAKKQTAKEMAKFKGWDGITQ